jgi:histone acetyltransferase (RNA polymerase elongator complex component)
MPVLHTIKPEEHIADIKKLFENPQLKPDILKIYQK